MKPVAVEPIPTGHTPADTMTLARSERVLYCVTNSDRETLFCGASPRGPWSGECRVRSGWRKWHGMLTANTHLSRAGRGSYGGTPSRRKRRDRRIAGGGRQRRRSLTISGDHLTII